MPHVQRSVYVHYSAEQMFDLVEDVESYPQFLPWCAGSRIVADHEGRHGREHRHCLPGHPLELHDAQPAPLPGADPPRTDRRAVPLADRALGFPAAAGRCLQGPAFARLRVRQRTCWGVRWLRCSTRSPTRWSTRSRCVPSRCMDPPDVRVTVVYCAPGCEDISEVTLPAGATVGDAIGAAGSARAPAARSGRRRRTPASGGGPARWLSPWRTATGWKSTGR